MTVAIFYSAKNSKHVENIADIFRFIIQRHGQDPYKHLKWRAVPNT